MALTEYDRKLIGSCLEHSPGAWNDFVDRYTGLLIHVIHHTAHARSVLLRPEDVEDLCAEIMLQIVADDYGLLRRFRGNASLATYLTVIARRICVRQIVKRHATGELGHGLVGSSGGSSVEIPATAESRVDDADEVRRMMEGLGRKEADVVRLYHLDGKSYREIAQALNVPENSVGPTLTRAREKLRRLAQARGVT